MLVAAGRYIAGPSILTCCWCVQKRANAIARDAGEYAVIDQWIEQEIRTKGPVTVRKVRQDTETSLKPLGAGHAAVVCQKRLHAELPQAHTQGGATHQVCVCV